MNSSEIEKERKKQIMLIDQELSVLTRELETMQGDKAFSKLDVPYVPSSKEKVEIMIKLASITDGIKAADLGSGDGRIVVALAKAGAYAYGFELEENRVILSQENIKREKLDDKAFIHHKNFFDINFAPYDVVTIYGLSGVMEKLEEKFLDELRPGSKVVSNTFIFPTWHPIGEEKGVYLYQKH